MTNKQRAAEAHAHYIIHHGSGTDAARFLHANTRSRSISSATTQKLLHVCPAQTPTTPAILLNITTPLAPQPLTPTPITGTRTKIPTWEEARITVFSSSSEESLPLPPPQSLRKIPPTSKWDAAAAMVYSSSGSSDSDASLGSSPSPHKNNNSSTSAQTPTTTPPKSPPFKPKLSPISVWAEDSSDADVEASQDDDSTRYMTPQPLPHPPTPTATPPTTPLPQRSSTTRSMTARKRRLEAANALDREQSPSVRVKAAKKQCSRYKPKPSVRPKAVKIAPSSIKGAGLGLYILEDVKKGEFVARYSGEVIDRITNAARRGHYRIKISKNVYLDAEKLHHFEGRYINDGKRAKRGVNVRFAAGYQLNTCSVTNLKWIQIFKTRDIRAGEELVLDYGTDFWDNNESVNPAKQTQPLSQAPPRLFAHAPPHRMGPTTTINTLSPILRAPKSRLQPPQPFSGILLLQPPSPWAPTTTLPSIHGYFNTHSNPQHAHTHNMNDSLPLNDTTHNNTLILNDTLKIMNTTHILL